MPYVEPYQCIMCTDGRKYGTMASLKRHQAVAHPKTAASIAKPAFHRRATVKELTITLTSGGSVVVETEDEEVLLKVDDVSGVKLHNPAFRPVETTPKFKAPEHEVLTAGPLCPKCGEEMVLYEDASVLFHGEAWTCKLCTEGLREAAMEAKADEHRFEAEEDMRLEAAEREAEARRKEDHERGTLGSPDEEPQLDDELPEELDPELKKEDPHA